MLTKLVRNKNTIQEYFSRQVEQYHSDILSQKINDSYILNPYIFINSSDRSNERVGQKPYAQPQLYNRRLHQNDESEASYSRDKRWWGVPEFYSPGYNQGMWTRYGV